MVIRRLTGVLVVACACLGVTSGARAAAMLYSGESLGSGQALTSADGHYTLTMQPDGNLVLAETNPYGSPRTLFSSGTGNWPGASAQLQGNGDLVVLDSTGATVWSANRTANGCANLVMQDDGNLVAYTSAGEYWASHTTQHGMQPGDELLPGQSLVAPGDRYELEMLTDGYLQLVDSRGIVWTSPDGGPAGSYAVLYRDGDFEIRSASGTRDWYTKTYSSADADATLKLTSSGNLKLVTTAGDVAWDSDTGADRSDLKWIGLSKAKSYTGCPAPPPPPPTPIHKHPPVSTTPPTLLRLPGVRVKISLRWRYDGKVTSIHSARVTRFPRAARLTVTCRGRRGCPTRRVTVRHRRVMRRARFSADGRHVRALLRNLVGRRFHAGDRVVFTVSERGHRSVRSEAIIRDGRRPRSRALP